MAQPTYPISVIDSKFCTPGPIDLTVARKVLNITQGNFVVVDANGNLKFKVKGSLLSLHDRRVLLDADGNPIVTLRQKILSVHRRWLVFKGDSSETEDLVFSVKKSSIIQFKTELNVFLATNTEEELCDFKVKGSWFERSCTIYAGDTSTIIAQMHKKHSVPSVVLGKDTYAVTVYPNVDYAFIVALLVILEDINKDKDD